jgi:hypothetical protein
LSQNQGMGGRMALNTDAAAGRNRQICAY